MRSSSPDSTSSNSCADAARQIIEKLAGTTITIPESEPLEVSLGIAHKKLWQFESSLVSAHLDLFVRDSFPGDVPEPIVQFSVYVRDLATEECGVMTMIKGIELCPVEDNSAMPIKGEVEGVGFLLFSKLNYGDVYTVRTLQQ